MKSFFPQIWRLLLTIALIGNPLAAMAAPVVAADADPCAGMSGAEMAAMHGHDARASKAAQQADRTHGCPDEGCSEAMCAMGACLAHCVLFSGQPGARLMPSRASATATTGPTRAVAGPPLAPLLRPPIH